MKRMSAFAMGAVLALVGAQVAGSPAAAAVDDATQKKVDAKAGKMLEAMKIEDAPKAAKVKGILGEWLVTMWGWHAAHDAELNGLWKEWNDARDWKKHPKDEFPAEVVAYKIEGVYASLKPAYEAFIGKLSAELTPEQLDAFKEAWSRSPGMKRTYNAYLEIVPDLKEEDKKLIADRMNLAREAAMLTDADKEIVAIYKRHKLKVEQYVGTLEWAKLHSAFGKATPKDGAKAPAAPAK